MTLKPWIPPAGEVVAPPVHPETIVDVIYSDHECTTCHPAHAFNWSAVGDGPCIVAYAVVEEYVEPVKAREWWGFCRSLHDTREDAEAMLAKLRETNPHLFVGLEVFHVREVSPAVNPAPREVVAWAVVWDRGCVAGAWSCEDNALDFSKSYGGTVVRLTGEMP